MHVDIVVPVWNRPTETRNCLVNLIEHSPGCRLILVDNGSERETESMLEEFADGLEDRALLMRSEANIGFVPAVNAALSRVEAPFSAVVRQTTIVDTFWLAPLLRQAEESPRAGILVPHGADDTARPASQCHVCETAQGSFAAMLLRTRMVRAIGRLDESLDGGSWCLKDYSRRAFASGYTTHSVGESRVTGFSEVELGSVERRRQAADRSRDEYERRWCPERCFLLEYAAEGDEALLREHAPILETAARQGHRLRLLVHRRIHRKMRDETFLAPHSSIEVFPLPAFMAARAAERSWSDLRASAPAAIRVSPAGPVGSFLPFADLAAEILNIQRERFTPGSRGEEAEC